MLSIWFIRSINIENVDRIAKGKKILYCMAADAVIVAITFILVK